MHFAVLINIVRSWRVAVARGEERKVAAIADGLRGIVADDVVFAAAASEPGPQDLTRPSTTATRVGGGWAINGRKAFATMAPAATILNVAVTFVDARGEDRYGFALVPTTSRGLVFHDDWDALGMRASASGSVSFEDVRIAFDALRDGFPPGRTRPPSSIATSSPVPSTVQRPSGSPRPRTPTCSPPSAVVSMGCCRIPTR